MSNPTREQFARLRGSVDGNDKFMKGCAVLGNPQSAHKNRLERMQQQDAWAFDPENVQGLLLRTFPKMRTDESQKQRAGRWALTIHMFFKEGITARRIAMRRVNEHYLRGVWVDLDEEIKRTEDTIRRIRRAAAGLRTTGKPRSTRKRGRPKKVSLAKRAAPK